MKRRASIIIVLAVLFLPVIALVQDRRSIDWFDYDANHHSKPLLLKLLQFTAPYPGFYYQTTVDTNGTAFTARNVPNWAMQNSRNAKLSDALLDQIKQLLAELNASTNAVVVEPESNRLHSVFVFYDGHDFLRLNYNGPNPAPIEAILEILNKEFAAAERTREEAIAAHQKMLRETYGDWQNRPGVTIHSGAQMHGCKGNGALVVRTEGQRRNLADGSLTTVSLYHALVFHPLGAVASSGTRGGRNNPLQTYELIWRVPNANGSFSEPYSERKLEILHNAIDASITIAGKTYHLNDGNMFVVRIGADWQPTVTQLKEIFEEQTTPQASLNRFKALYKNDASIQQLEPY